MDRAARPAPAELHAYLAAHGAPIRYAHEPEPRPLEDHQTIFATEPGSAEMPSAGRPFTKRALTRLRERGVSVQRIVAAHRRQLAGARRAPLPRALQGPRATPPRASTHAPSRRVIAVGTTVVRALETVADDDGRVHAGTKAGRT